MTDELLALGDRVSLTQTVFRVLGNWRVPAAEMPHLLGLANDLKLRHFNRYRLGTPLPDDPAVLARVALLLDIENGLHKMFPHSELSANLWVTTPAVGFGRKTPLQVMLGPGIDGLRQVADFLNNRAIW